MLPLKAEQGIMEKRFKKNLITFFKSKPQIKLAYLFGSQGRGEAGALSDYDFAFYLAEKDPKEIFEIRLQLLSRLSRLFKTDNLDVVILNTIESPELKYDIIKDGELIFEREPYRVLIEPKILNEYFDFHILLSRYNLTKVK